MGEIYIDLISRLFVYKVIKGGNTEGGEQFVCEDDLSYGLDCPVKVKGLVENQPNKELEGKISCPWHFRADGTYTITFLLEGNNIRVEKRVDPKLITYNPPVDELESMEEKRATMGSVGDKNGDIIDPKNDMIMEGDGKQMDIAVPDVESAASSLVKSEITEGTARQENDNKPSNVSAKSTVPLANSNVHHGQLKRSNSTSLSKEQSMAPPNLNPQQLQRSNSAQSGLASVEANPTSPSMVRRWQPPPVEEHSLQSETPENQIQKEYSRKRKSFSVNIPTDSADTTKKQRSPATTCILTVPSWLMDTCKEGNELFRKFALPVVVRLFWLVSTHSLSTSLLLDHLIGRSGSKTKHICS